MVGKNYLANDFTWQQIEIMKSIFVLLVSIIFSARKAPGKMDVKKHPQPSVEKSLKHRMVAKWKCGVMENKLPDGESHAKSLEDVRLGLLDERDKRIATLEAEVKLLRGLVEVCGEVANRLAEELKPAKAERDRLRDAAEELLEVAYLRGDNDLPHPSDSDKLWTAGMQTAWNELKAALSAKGE